MRMPYSGVGRIGGVGRGGGAILIGSATQGSCLTRVASHGRDATIGARRRGGRGQVVSIALLPVAVVINSSGQLPLLDQFPLPLPLPLRVWDLRRRRRHVHVVSCSSSSTTLPPGHQLGLLCASFPQLSLFPLAYGSDGVCIGEACVGGRGRHRMVGRARGRRGGTRRRTTTAVLLMGGRWPRRGIGLLLLLSVCRGSSARIRVLIAVAIILLLVIWWLLMLLRLLLLVLRRVVQHVLLLLLLLLLWVQRRLAGLLLSCCSSCSRRRRLMILLLLLLRLCWSFPSVRDAVGRGHGECRSDLWLHLLSASPGVTSPAARAPGAGV